MFRCLPILCAALAACSAPGPYFRSAAATRVVVDGSAFDVRVRGGLAEAVRITPQYAPRLGPIRGRAAFAMAQVSGCAVREVLGDQAQLTGLLACEGGSQYPVGPVLPVAYSCLEVSQWLNEGPGPDYAEFECDPV